MILAKRKDVKVRRITSAALSIIMAAGLALSGNGLTAYASEVLGDNAVILGNSVTADDVETGGADFSFDDMAAEGATISDGDVNNKEMTVSEGDAAIGKEAISKNNAQGFSLLSVPRASAGDAKTRLGLAKKITETIMVDGNLTEFVWSDETVDSYSVAYLADATVNNNKCVFKTAWDDSKLYIGVDVTDADVVSVENGGKLSDNIFENDGIEIFIDGDNSKNTKGGYDKKNDYHLFIQHDGTVSVQGGTAGTWGVTQELDGKLEAAVLMTEDGYNVEIAVPFEAIGIATPTDGSVMGLTVTNNDNDNYESNARKDIWWFEGHGSGNPSTWGTVCLYMDRKPLVSVYGTPVFGANWDEAIWNFENDYALNFANISGATLKFASLSNYDAFYYAMLIEGAGANVPFVETILSGTNKRSGGRDKECPYDYIMQWNPTKEQSWEQMNITIGKGATKPDSKKYALGDGNYAVVVKFPWDYLSEISDPEMPRENYSMMSFSIATGNDSNIKDGVNTRWTDSSAWSNNSFNTAASILIYNDKLFYTNPNEAPKGTTQFYSYSIPQGGSASGKLKVTDANEGDKLTYSCVVQEGYDETASGVITVNSETGEWTYTTPNADFASCSTNGKNGINFWIDATDPEGASYRTRIQVRVEYKPTNLTYYVDGDTGRDSNDGLSHEMALKTINAAHDKTRPGDTVLIYGSTVPYGWYTKEEYDENDGLYMTVRNGALVITHSGLPDAPITYKAAENEVPVIKSNGTWKTVKIAANYINFEDIVVQGKTNEDEMTYEKAYEAFWAKIAPKDGDEYNNDWNYPCGNYNTGGIEIGPVISPSKNSTAANPISDAILKETTDVVHHITVKNCISQNNGGTGIGGNHCDYVTFENCSSLNNGWWEMYASSGFGFIDTIDIDDNTDDYKLIIRNNIAAGNRHFIPWKASTVRLSDGNGIILDTMDDHGYAYQGKTMVANNLVYENGGSGIHAFRADNADFVNNTVFNNGATPELGWSEMFANDAENVNMYNNIVYSRTGNREDIKVSTASVVYDYNIFYNYANNSNVESGAPNDSNNQFKVDPKFTSVIPVADMPENFDKNKDYPESWYTVKTANEDIKPASWSCAANAAAAGWYLGVDYDVTKHGYDFTLKSDSPAIGAANVEWMRKAGATDSTQNRSGIFSEVGSDINLSDKEPTTPGEPTTPEEPATPEEPTTPEEPATPEEPTTPEEPSKPSIDTTNGDSDNQSESPKYETVTVPVEYIVVKGDTLIRIAAKHNLLLGALKMMNPQITYSNLIYPGQKIILGYVQKQVAANGGAASNSETLKNAKYYVLQRGDSLNKIAHKHSIALPQLIAMNAGFAKQKYIYAGQVLRIK